MAAGTTAYLLSDKHPLVRGKTKQESNGIGSLNADERKLLFLASLAPGGHNTQPWFVQYLEPYRTPLR